MAALDDIQVELSGQLQLIRQEFIDRYLPARPEDGPDIYHQHVKAFCILAHAALEEFAEKVSLAMMKNAVDGWYANKTIGAPLAALLLYYNASIKPNTNEDEDQIRNFDLFRSAVEFVKQSHSRAVFDNHGFSLKYLRSILTPVAVDISSDPPLISSLKILADARGSYAHTSAAGGFFTDRNKAKHPMTPEKARDIVIDCHKLCEKILEDAKRNFLT